jgi:hypothetical protein
MQYTKFVSCSLVISRMWQQVTRVSIACFLAYGPALAQTVFRDLTKEEGATIQAREITRTVFPISEIKLSGPGIVVEQGTGFCLDPSCRFIATNYHVAKLTRPRKIRGQKVIHQYLATGPGDEDASMNDGESVGPMRFALCRDLAVFELRHPLHKYHGIPFSTDELEVGQGVDIYTYPKEGISPFRNLLRFHAAFKGETTTGLLAFDYELSAGKAIRPGASGGIVVDRVSQCIVGVLSGIGRNGETVALAVPVGSLADFVNKIEPVLAESLFPENKTSISPTLVDLHPKLAPLTRSHFRPAESEEIQALRAKAQVLADGMNNFIAVQTFEWGSKNNPPARTAAYEVQVIDGDQKFRDYPDGKKQYSDVPFPTLNTSLVPGGEWSELPEMVGKDLHLRILQTEDATVDGKLIKVFQYQGDVEDAVCTFRTDLDFGFFAIKKVATVSCYGEVWTDENLNIIRMSEHYEMAGKWKDYMAVMTYGWLKRADESPRLIPLTISTQATYGRTVHWCRGKFVNYHIFSTRARVISE